MTADAIAAGLDGRLPSSDLASVYRNLDTLEEIGLVRHFHVGHGPGLYALATHRGTATPRASAAARTRPLDHDTGSTPVARDAARGLRLRATASPTSRSSALPRCPDAMTMHIPDGFLAPEVAVACAVPGGRSPSASGCGARAVDLDERRVPLLGVTAAFVFAAQMLNFPVAGGTSGHFLGAALAAILLGPWLACLVMSVVLVAQAFVFADGGITALGANILNMGVIGALLVGGLMLARAARAAAARGAFLAVAGVGAWLAVDGRRGRAARSSSRSPAPCRSAPCCRRCSACTR